MQAGFDGYLSKPVDIDELLSTVEQPRRRRGR
jgi:DNA-binding response OmpR family regulator